MTGFIGGGNMAEALIRGMTAQRIREVIVSEPGEERRQHLENTLKVKTTASNRKVVSLCGTIILAVKPQIMDTVLDEIREEVTEEKTVVSIAAGTTLSYLSSRLKTKKLIRVMPNTPALVQEGMSVLSMCDCFYGKEVDEVKGIFMSVGRVMVLPENMMNAVTAVSGSGPAFVALFVESMINAGIKMGLSEPDASGLAIQTLIGTARLLDTGMRPYDLRKMVTSPGGTTAEGLRVFEEKDLQGIVATALLAAEKRAEELGRKG